MNSVLTHVPATQKRWRVETLLEIFVGVTAVVGGSLLIAAPDGSLSKLSLELLKYSPFHDYFWPGVLLVVFVGALNLVAAGVSVLKWRFAPIVALTSGGALVIYIVAEGFMIPVFHPLQLVYSALGILIGLSSMPKRQTE